MDIQTQEKNKILVIAPTLPYYDRASGDNRLFSILKILCEKYKIIYLCQRGRSTDIDRKYIKDLEELNIDLYRGFSYFKTIMRGNKFHSVFIEFFKTAEYYIPRIRIIAPGCPIIVDSVDVHFYRQMLKYNVTNDSADLQIALQTKRRELAMYRKADLVIAVSKEDAEILKNECEQIEIDIIPNIHKIPSKAGCTPDVKNRNSLIFIGGFHHKPNIDAVIYFCRQILPLVKNSSPNVKLTIIGDNAPEEIKALSDKNVKILGHVPSVAPYLQKSRISIAPLRYGAGIKGKVSEAMAHGVPVVTTSIGVQGLDVRNREHIIIADTPEDFARSIIQLIYDDRLHNELSVNSLNYINMNLTPDKIRPQIIKIFEDIRHISPKKMLLKEKAIFFTKYVYERTIGYE